MLETNSKGIMKNCKLMLWSTRLKFENISRIVPIRHLIVLFYPPNSEIIETDGHIALRLSSSI